MNRLDIVSDYFSKISQFDASTEIAEKLGYKEVISKKTFRHDSVLNEYSFVIDCLLLKVSVKCENLQFCRVIHSIISYHDNLTVFHCDFTNCTIKLKDTERGINEYRDCSFVACKFVSINKSKSTFINCRFIYCEGVLDGWEVGNTIETE